MRYDILCCLYSEFNTEKGAEIILQFPKEYLLFNLTLAT